MAFLFNLVDQATYEFAKIFHKRVADSNLLFHQIEKPRLEDLRETLQVSINEWYAPAKRFKEKYGEPLDTFNDLLPIPEHKRYGLDYSTTVEQRLTCKMYRSENLIDEEKVIIQDIQTYYADLNAKLEVLDYSTFTLQDLLNFKNYIHYAFDFHFVVSNRLEITYELYRLVVNENVCGVNSRLLYSRYFTYPPLTIIQKLGKYNRASTSDSTLLYLTESVDTALKGLKPPENRLVTFGIWLPKHRHHFNSFPIEHNHEAPKVNE